MPGQPAAASTQPAAEKAATRPAYTRAIHADASSLLRAKSIPEPRKARAFAITTSGNSYETKDRAEGKLLSGPASRTAQFLPHMLEAALRGCYPVMVGVRRIIPNVLLMPALQFRHPGAVYIHMIPNNLAQNPARLRFHWPHTSILRAFLCLHLNFWQPRRLRQQPQREVLHSVCYANKAPFRRRTEHGSGQRNSGCNPGANHFSQRRTLAGHSGRASHKEPRSGGRVLETVLPRRPRHDRQDKSGRQILTKWMRRSPR